MFQNVVTIWSHLIDKSVYFIIMLLAVVSKHYFLLLFHLYQFFNQVLMLGKTSVSDLSEHVFDLILELYNIDSHLLLSVLPQLEFKLKV